MAERQKMVTAVFRNREDAESAFDALMASGYADNEVDVMMSEKTRSTYYSQSDEPGKHQVGSKFTEGMGVGGAVGTAVGAALGAVVAIGTAVALPGLGLIVAGPIVGALAGAGAGGVAGGMVGALVGLGISEENAESYQQALRNGGVVVGVRPHSGDDASRIQQLFKDLRGENILYS